MKVSDITQLSQTFEWVCEGDASRDISKVFCCDLLSAAMGKAPFDCAWITVMGNINTLAVASLCDVSVIVLAEGAAMDENALAKAREQRINVIKTSLPVFESGLLIHNCLGTQA